MKIEVYATSIINGEEYRKSIEIDTNCEEKSIKKLHDLYYCCKNTAKLLNK